MEATMCKFRKRSLPTRALLGCALAIGLVAAGLGSTSAGAQAGTGPEPGVLQGAFQSPPFTPVRLNIDLRTLPVVEPGPFVPAQTSPDDEGEENPPAVGTPGGASAHHRAVLDATKP